MVADGATAPIDKACGEVLMPDAVGALKNLGVALSIAEHCTLRGVRFFTSGLSAEAVFPFSCGAVAIRRSTLHRIMAERAATMGTTLLWDRAVTGICGEKVQLGDRGIRASWIIGADGVNSRVRRWVGLEAYSRTKLRYAFRRHYRVKPWTDRMEIYWGRRSQAYATGVNNEQVCVAAASPNPTLRLEEALPNFQSSRHA